MDLFEKLELHDTLNPNIWNSDNTLKEEVRDRLLQIVDFFKETLDIPLEIADIQLVGSNASFNYNDQSDLDAHIIVNFDLIPIPEEYTQVLYNFAKSSFNSKYDISIHGVEVELYVDDIKSGLVSNGIYSVLKDKWLKFPKPIEIPSIDISQDVNDWKARIDNIINNSDLEELKNCLNDLYLLRRASLVDEGEFSKGNLIFKELRNQGYLDRLKNKITEFTSDELTLEDYSLGTYIARN